MFVAWRYHISLALAGPSRLRYLWLQDTVQVASFTPRLAAALSGVFVLVDGPHGTCTVQLVAVMGVAAAPSPERARAGNETTKSTAGVTGESDNPLACSLRR